MDKALLTQQKQRVLNLLSKVPNGLLTSVRAHPILPLKRNDNNIFFSLSSVFVLKGLRNLFDSAEHEELNRFYEKVKLCAEAYKNKDELLTYNFWKTRPSQHFPNGKFMHKRRFFKLPDDADDTCLYYLAFDMSKSEAQVLKAKLGEHANLHKGQNRQSFKEFQHLPIYSTWFGEQMYIEFDAGVLSNIMYWVFQYQLPLDEKDEAVLYFISESIRKGYYFSHPFRLSPEYPNTALILYHYSRLISAHSQYFDSEVIAKLKQDVKKAECETKSDFLKMILQLSLLKLGVKPEAMLSAERYQKIKNEVFFSASFLTQFTQFSPKMVSCRFFQLYFYCREFTELLKLEFLFYAQTADDSE